MKSYEINEMIEIMIQEIHRFFAGIYHKPRGNLAKIGGHVQKICLNIHHRFINSYFLARKLGGRAVVGGGRVVHEEEQRPRGDRAQQLRAPRRRPDVAGHARDDLS